MIWANKPRVLILLNVIARHSILSQILSYRNTSYSEAIPCLPYKDCEITGCVDLYLYFTSWRSIFVWSQAYGLMKLIQHFTWWASNREMPPSLQQTLIVKVSTNEIVIGFFMNGYNIDRSSEYMIQWMDYIWYQTWMIHYYLTSDIWLWNDWTQELQMIELDV